MSTIEQSIDVNVLVRTAYNQWTQFEEFPRRVAGDLQRFKAFIEARGQETGAWRGEVERPGR